jgi:hypothetical protein
MSGDRSKHIQEFLDRLVGILQTFLGGEARLID